jgi:hypothetical protein
MPPTNVGPGAVASAEAVDLNVAERRPDPNTTAKANARAAAARLHRETFRTSRLLEFCSIKEHLRELRVGSGEPIVVVLHYTCPRVEFTDRGKTALVIPE